MADAQEREFSDRALVPDLAEPRPLDPAYDPAEAVSARILCSAMLAGVAGLLVAARMSDWLSATAWTGWTLGAPLGVISLYVALRLYTKASIQRTLWRIDSRALRIERGVIWRSRIDVPRSRVQHTDVSRGPLERRFGLATLIVHTAGTHQGQVRLAGLRAEEARWARRTLIDEDRDSGEEAQDLPGQGLLFPVEDVPEEHRRRLHDSPEGSGLAIP